MMREFHLTPNSSMPYFRGQQMGTDWVSANLRPLCPLQFLLVIGTGGGNEHLLLGDDQGSLGGSSAVEQLFHHGLKGGKHVAFACCTALFFASLQICEIPKQVLSCHAFHGFFCVAATAQLFQ